MISIFFDVDGVLIRGYHAKPELQHCWDKDLENDFNVKRSDFFNSFIKGPFEQEVLLGKKSLYSALEGILPQIGYSGPIQAFVDYWLTKDSKINSDLLDTIQQLSKSPDVSLYIATNQAHERAAYLMEELGFAKLFKDIFYSAKLGITKTNPRFFEQTQLMLGIKKEDIIFFDDNQSVIDSARSCGWEAHQFDTTQDLYKSERIRSIIKALSKGQSTFS